MLIPGHIYQLAQPVEAKDDTGADVTLPAGMTLAMDRFYAGQTEDDLAIVVRDLEKDRLYTIPNGALLSLRRSEKGVAKVFTVKAGIIYYTKDGGFTIKKYDGDIGEGIRQLVEAGYVNGKVIGVDLEELATEGKQHESLH